jgi:hypothetical protein
MEAKVELSALLGRFPRILLAVGPPISLMNGLESFPVRLV